MLVIGNRWGNFGMGWEKANNMLRFDRKEKSTQGRSESEVTVQAIGTRATS